ncbi:MAG: helix-turn-helix domain-containing protein [Dethiobacter sp.]|nr:helix-turn-helix domain-containing protein [Dethiobacter sp.]MBS3902687.1 helix-turn-helix domain-containing protein [Dethiobacter sp.]MBS3989740.1 helix-turn-helix domain-containing protein [Dethiobacter sp.]
MENYYTPKEISDKLKLNIRTIYKWIREEKINAVKLGDVWRISESELQRLLKGETE